MTVLILERILRCKFCGREMTCSPLSYEENPFCMACLPERVKASKPKGRVRWRTEGHYVIAEAIQTRRPGAGKRQRG